MSFSIGQFAQLAGITPRMLRHYDRLALLTPSRVGQNGYRWYEREDLHRLQRILLLRDLGLSLPAIAEVLVQDRATDEVEVLIEHRKLVVAERDRLTQVAKTLDRTIEELLGGTRVEAERFFDGLQSRRMDVRAAITAQFGDDGDAAFKQGVERTAGWSKADYDSAARRGLEVQEDLAALMRNGRQPSSPDVLEVVGRHHSLISETWRPDRTAYSALAQLYLTDQFQRSILETVDPDLPGWLALAMTCYADSFLD